MALSDLAVFSEYTYEAMTEVLAQQVDLFNAASGGTIILAAGAHQGDYSDTAFWAAVQGLVRRRNAYGTGAVAEKNLQHLTDTMVKVAAGTPPVRVDPSQFEWIQRNQEEGGAVYGQQLAKSTLADMLNTAIASYVAAVVGHTDCVYKDETTKAKLTVLNEGQRLFGDRSGDLRAWLMHSSSMFDIFGAALTNTEKLFTFGTVNVRTDGFGRPFIVTDSDNLTFPDDDGAGADVAGHYIAGLTGAAIRVDMNGDFVQNTQTVNGDENIKRTIQSEWSYNLGIKGYAWDKTNGGKSPNDAALATGTNWDRYATSFKDTAGVLIKVQ
jgi:hypothetical protein